MTYKEAADMIRDDMRLHHDYLSGQYRKALKLAIEVLEKQDKPVSPNWSNDPMTEKQKEMIASMQENAGINGALPLPDFNGKTKGEACDYIQANLHRVYETMDYLEHEDAGDRI